MNKNHPLSLLVFALAFLLASSEARADPAAVEPPAAAFGPSAIEAAPVSTKRYGHHILLADSGVVALTAVALAGDTVRPEVGLGLLLTGPAVHIAHGNPGRALGSFALRAGLPFLGGATTLLIANCPSDASEDDDYCGLAVAPGLLLGVAAAIVIDSAVLARETVVSSTPTLVPVASVNPSSGAMQLGLGGTF